MKHPNWDRIQEIYHAALALPRSEWGAYVSRACDNDLDLLLEVFSLLKADDSASGFLESPVIKLAFAPENLVGQTLDERYLIERELSRGGMSQVYVAVDLRLRRQAVVIKILSQEMVHDSYARQKFEQEVEALLRVDDAGVVRVLDVGQLPDERPYIVMQYVDGETLRSQIPAEGMRLDRVASILEQVGAALEHVHQKGIFHRDLKPENIVTKRDTDSVVLLDFGIAKVKNSVIAPSTAHGASVGTLLYMSPEQLRGENVTAACDIYSMGLIAYELITGRRPFNPTSASQLLEMQRAGVRVKPVHLREDLSAKAQAMILRALSFDPRMRYQSAQEFGHKLAQTLLESRVRVPHKRWLRVAAASLAILVCALFVSVGYYKSNGQEIDHSEKFGVASSEPSYPYVINEGPPEPNSTSFVIVCPASPSIQMEPAKQDEVKVRVTHYKTGQTILVRF